MSVWPSTEFTIVTPFLPQEIELRLRPHVLDSDAAWFDVAPGNIPEFVGAFWDGGLQVRLMTLNPRYGPTPNGSLWIATYDLRQGSTAVRISSIRDWRVWGGAALLVILESGAVVGRFGAGAPQIAAAAGIALIVLIVVARLLVAHRDNVRARLTRWIMPDV